MSVESEFRTAMASAGIETDDEIVADGDLHRIHVESDKPHRRNGWFVLHPDEPAAGAFGCWKRGVSETWCAAAPDDLSGDARERWREKVAQRRQERERERERKRQRARRKAARLLEEADPADPAHPYLEDKEVRPHGIRQLGSTLLVPVYGPEGKLRGLQRIAPDGRKRFLAGTEVSGGYLPLGGTPNGRLIVTEGFSTAATLLETTEEAVAVAFNAGNLEPAARALRSKLDDEIEIIVAADNDHATEGNPGVTAATEAARAVDGLLAVPAFPNAGTGTDFNDLAVIEGSDAVREAVEGAAPPEGRADDVEAADTGFLDSLDLDWGPPIPLGPETPDDLPPETLPSPLREHVESVAASTQTPSALPLSMALAAVSAAVAGKAIVTVRAGWEGEPLNTYWAAVLNPGERKSPVERKMASPLREHDRQAASRLGPEHRASLDREAALEKRLKRAQRAFADADGAAEEGEALDALEDARQRLEDLEIEAPPRLLTNDVTSEALGRMMANNAGRAAILSSEGDVLRIFAGKYSSGDPTLDLLKKAHDGDPVRVDRVGRDGVHLPCPLLTVGITLQPALLKGLANRDALEGEGVLARFLWIAPPSMVGHRKTGPDVPRPDEDARDQYERLLARLLETEPAGVEKDGQWEPHSLELTPEARSRLYDWEADVEQMLAPGGELAALGFWGNKVVGRTLRLAGLFHVVERAGRAEDPFAAPVGVESMQDAIHLARLLVSHARFVLVAELGADRELTLAEYLLRRIRELTPDDGTPPSTSDLLQVVKQKRGLETAEKLDTTLETLEAHNQIRRVERPSEGPGRNPAPLVLLNPESPKEVQEIQEKASGGDYLDFLDASQGSDDASPESTEDDADSEPVSVPTGNEIIGDDTPADPDDVGVF